MQILDAEPVVVLNLFLVTFTDIIEWAFALVGGFVGHRNVGLVGDAAGDAVCRCRKSRRACGGGFGGGHEVGVRGWRCLRRALWGLWMERHLAVSLKFHLGGQEESTGRQGDYGFGKKKQCRAKFAGWQKRIGLGRAFSFSCRPSYTAEGFRQRVGAVFGDRRDKKCDS